MMMWMLCMSRELSSGVYLYKRYRFDNHVSTGKKVSTTTNYLSTPNVFTWALVWFWIIDETLVLTSILSVCRLNEVGTCQVMEQVMIMVMMVMTTRWSSAQLRKKEREKQNPMEIKTKVLLRVLVFSDQDIIEGVITFRINSRTIKRGILWPSGYQVPLCVIVHEHVFRT